MVITESELREMWRDGRHALPVFESGTRFSPSAQDFLKEHDLVAAFAAPADLPVEPPQPAPDGSTLSEPRPHSLLAARLEALQALSLLVAAEARRYQLPALATRLEALTEHLRALRLAAVQGVTAAPTPVEGVPGATPHAAGSQAEGQAVPGDHAILHWLNYLRSQVADAEDAARRVAPTKGERPTASGATDLSGGLHDLHLAVSGLMRQFQSGELGWSAVP